MAVIALGLMALATNLSANTTIFSDNFNSENGGVGALNYTAFTNWTVTSGQVDLIGNGFFDFLPGHGLYIDTDGTGNSAGTLGLTMSLALAPGNYTLTFMLAGSQRAGPESMTATVQGLVAPVTYTLAANVPFTLETINFNVASNTMTSLIFAGLPPNNVEGLLLDDIKLDLINAVPDSGNTAVLLGLAVVGMLTVGRVCPRRC